MGSLTDFIPEFERTRDAYRKQILLIQKAGVGDRDAIASLESSIRSYSDLIAYAKSGTRFTIERAEQAV